jgi:hypothetical protein
MTTGQAPTPTAAAAMNAYLVTMVRPSSHYTGPRPA